MLGGSVSLGSGAVAHDRWLRRRRVPSWSRASNVHTGGIGNHQRRWNARTSRVRPTGEGSDQPLSRFLPIDHRARRHPDFSHQLRRGSQLPAHLRRDVGRGRCGDAGSSPRGECRAAPTRDRASQGAGVRQSPGRLDRSLAGHDVGPYRNHHRSSRWGWWSVGRSGGRSPTTSALSRSRSCRSGSWEVWWRASSWWRTSSPSARHW